MNKQDKSSEEHPISHINTFDTKVCDTLSKEIGISSVESLFGFLIISENREKIQTLLGISHSDVEQLIKQCTHIIGHQKATQIRETKSWIGPMGLASKPQEGNDE